MSLTIIKNCFTCNQPTVGLGFDCTNCNNCMDKMRKCFNCKTNFVGIGNTCECCKKISQLQEKSKGGSIMIITCTVCKGTGPFCNSSTSVCDLCKYKDLTRRTAKPVNSGAVVDFDSVFNVTDFFAMTVVPKGEKPSWSVNSSQDYTLKGCSRCKVWCSDCYYCKNMTEIISKEEEAKWFQKTGQIKKILKEKTGYEDGVCDCECGCYKCHYKDMKSLVKAAEIITSEAISSGECAQFISPAVIEELSKEIAVTEFDDDYKGEEYDEHWKNTPIASTSSAHDSSSDYDPDEDDITLLTNEELDNETVALEVSEFLAQKKIHRFSTKKRTTPVIDLTVDESDDESVHSSKYQRIERLEDKVSELVAVLKEISQELLVLKTKVAYKD